MTFNSSSVLSSERSLHQHTALNNLDMLWLKLTWLHYLKFCNNVLLSEYLLVKGYTAIFNLVTFFSNMVCEKRLVARVAMHY
jgi:hypothetical protein